MDKKQHCPQCGVLRTLENNSIISDEKGGQKWYYTCKKCAALKAKRKRYSEMAKEEIMRIYSTIIERKAMMDEIIVERNIYIN